MDITLKLEDVKHKGECLEEISDGEYITTCDVCADINGYIITIPKGFETDLCSVPEMLESDEFPHDGKYWRACLVHDFLYDAKNIYGTNKEDSDDIFRYYLKKTDVAPATIALMMLAVTLAGGAYYVRDKINGMCPPERSAMIDRRKVFLEYKERVDAMFGGII